MVGNITQWLSSIPDTLQLSWVLVQASVIAIAAYMLVILARTITPAARVRISLLGLLLMALVPASIVLMSGVGPIEGWSWGQLMQAPPSPTAVLPADAPAAAVETAGAGQGDLTSWQQVSVYASELFVNRVTPTSDAAPSSESTADAPPRHWGITGSVLLFAASLCVAFGIARLLAGYWQIRKLRSSAVPIACDELASDLEEFRSELGIKPHVETAETSSLGSAAIVGWRRPLLLLPQGWRSWTDEERRAVLAHELAHVKRRDFASTAVGQLAVAINFYHPLAHIVLQRLRLDQELAADALAAQTVGGHQRYVEILAGLALRQPKVRTPGPCQAFLPPRRMFVRRLEMLRNLPKTGPTLNRCYSAFAALLLVAVATLSTGLRPHTLVAQETLRSGENAAEGQADQPTVASYIPAGLWEAVVCVDVQPAMATEGIQAILKQADLPEQFDVHGYKLKKDSITDIAIVMLSPSRGHAAAEPLVIIRSQESFQQRPQVRLLDSHTLAFHQSEEVLELLGIGGGDDELEGMLARNGDSHVRMASKTAWMQSFAQRVGDQGPAMAFAPLWMDVSILSAGVTLSDSLTISAQMDSTDPKKVSETLTALKFLGRNYLDSMSKATGELNSNPTQMVMAAAAAKAGTELLDSLEINSTADQVSISAELSDAAYPMIGLAVPAISSARTAARRTQSMNNMKQLMLAFHNYHDAYGHLPPAVVTDRDSGEKRSWRVELLPFLEHADLYQQYRKDQPWDSELNLRVLNKMPQVFAIAGTSGTTTTPYQAIVSEDGGLTMSGDREPKFRDFTDGLASTIMLAETTKVVPWTQPTDLSDTADLPRLGTSRASDPGIIVAMADGSVRFLSNNIDQKIWDALITRSGGETFGIE